MNHRAWLLLLCSCGGDPFSAADQVDSGAPLEATVDAPVDAGGDVLELEAAASADTGADVAGDVDQVHDSAPAADAPADGPPVDPCSVDPASAACGLELAALCCKEKAGSCCVASAGGRYTSSTPCGPGNFVCGGASNCSSCLGGTSCSYGASVGPDGGTTYSDHGTVYACQ